MNHTSPNRARHSGMTILEVLFAILITTVGLFGAIAVFPVASEYAKKGRLNDEVTVSADAAIHKVDAMGMRRPERWLTWRVINGNWQMMSGMIIPGESYCLDPRFVASNLVPNANPPLVPNYGEATAFPAFPRRPAAQASGPNDPDNAGNPGAPRMQRITLVNGYPGSAPPYYPAFIPMGRFQADYVFSFADQLAYERPGVQKGVMASPNNADPAFQLYSPIKTANGILPGKREEEGKLSWIATLVPKVDRWNPIHEGRYVLSIVVFYSRSPSLVIPDFSQPPATWPFVNEWTGMILGQSTTNPGSSDFHSSGYGGGEVTITATGSPDKLKMRAGDWLMLSGHVLARDPANNVPTTVTTYKWYRVSDADEDPYEFPLGSGIWKRDVSLIGPDWDMQNVLPFNMGAPQGDFDANGNPIFDDVEVTIVPHIVAVSDRTVQLELGGTGY